ncbi:M14 family metallopeptidase [Methanobrevibacter curvatus]|uniref:Succinylglutamate desuccinylase / aspartoacylase family protein n=1 Tax=Methanobrevibacter curvatus TaxID=49547 RepID=A0A162F9S8_9EURY|nr:succinylglutamate desuccinylase/aspartoacylase family protein [Methanobrevibacter curvatus]KZX09995.1 succinylglutamate desuccinylase / aspartoacylase family protein [Methanobrevibacter curvatus]
MRINKQIISKKAYYLTIIILLLAIFFIGNTALNPVDAVVLKNTTSNYTIKYFDTSSSVKGDAMKNKNISKYLPKGSLSLRIVNMSKNGSVILQFGSGNPKVLIHAGIHGDEAGASIATLKVIEKIKNRKFKGTIYIIPFVIPLDTQKNKRLWYDPRTLKNVDPNRIANKKNTPGYKILEFAKKNKVTHIIEVHTGGFISHRKNGLIWANTYPVKNERTWLKYIKKKANPYIGYGNAFSGMVRGVAKSTGIVAITLEVERDKKPFQNWIYVELKLLTCALNFFHIIK